MLSYRRIYLGPEVAAAIKELLSQDKKPNRYIYPPVVHCLGEDVENPFLLFEVEERSDG
jgi:hypothetical protein